MKFSLEIVLLSILLWRQTTDPFNHFLYSFLYWARHLTSSKVSVSLGEDPTSPLLVSHIVNVANSLQSLSFCSSVLARFCDELRVSFLRFHYMTKPLQCSSLDYHDNRFLLEQITDGHIANSSSLNCSTCLLLVLVAEIYFALF